MTLLEPRAISGLDVHQLVYLVFMSGLARSFPGATAPDKWAPIPEYLADRIGKECGNMTTFEVSSLVS